MVIYNVILMQMNLQNSVIVKMVCKHYSRGKKAENNTMLQLSVGEKWGSKSHGYPRIEIVGTSMGALK